MRKVVFRSIVFVIMISASVGAFAAGAQDAEGASAIPEGFYGKYDPSITLEFFKYIGSDGLERIRDGLTAATVFIAPLSMTAS